MNVKKAQSWKFLKSSRLLKHADFQAVYKEGKKHFSGNLTVYYRDRKDQAGPRVGFTVGKVLGGSVERNRIRRRLRAAVRRHLGGLACSLDVVLHPRKSVLDMDFARLDSEVGQLFAALERRKTKA
ncbi:MAG TPA: ribonuclease P protein component [Candidatus Angelobacter sp.]|nr:ribonuclease P protein component [Candidatus Angelobacter sp.]